MAASKQKIAVLGGGVSALAAVYGITSSPGWQDKYEITVYQVGWRLGGKGASGRSASHEDRIEEHGLHVWLGFYDNAFRIMRNVYQELGRPKGTPLATWREAFTPWNTLVLQEHLKDTWHTLPMELPPNDSLPGDGGVMPTLWDYIVEMLWMARKAFEESAHAGRASESGPTIELPHWWEQIVSSIEHGLSELALQWAGSFLILAHELAKTVSYDPAQPHKQATDSHEPIRWLLVKFKEWLWEQVKDRVYTNVAARLLWVTVDQMTANVYGMIADGVLLYGFDYIDDMDYRAWLKKNTANDFTLQYALFQAGYDLVFGYIRGIPDWPHGDMGAGTALRGAVRMFLTYKGAVAWRMNAGMGDTIFTPLYQVLRRRGVRFAFFHRLKALHLNEDGDKVVAMDMARQVTLKVGQYDPLIDVKDLLCWPSEPLYDQIVQGEELKARGINLESAWTDWEDVENRTLKLGTDFDLVIFGISLGAVPYVASELVEHKEKWRQMVERVKTVRTQAVQLWFRPDLKGLGWTATSDAPLMGAYAEPMGTWADLTALIERENWPDNITPGTLGYLVGVMPDDPHEPPPYVSKPDYPATQLEAVFAAARDWLEKYSGHLWPEAAVGPALDWEQLVDPSGGQGAQRLRAQYLRCNIDPSERYVLSVAGSLPYRMKTDETGVDNLYVTGDWIRNGLNSGCVESAAISGLQTSRAICGWPQHIIGEDDFVNTGRIVPGGCARRFGPEIIRTAAAALTRFISGLRSR